MSTNAVTRLPGRNSVPEEAVTNPHHILKNGNITGFQNPYPSWGGIIQPWTMLADIIWPVVTGKLKFPDKTPPTVPVVTPQWLPNRTASPNLRATWLGHACYYVEFPSGLRVLFDPVFEHRCSPFSFLGPQRFTKAPCELKNIPTIDAVVISHSHYDHLSHDSVLEIQKTHPNAHFFVGLGLEKWFRKSGLNNVTELDWWEEADLTVHLPETESKGKDSTISTRVTCLPCQHTSGRTPFDRDTTLWCSWAVKSGGKNVWFGGDTGYRAVPAASEGVDDYGAKYESLPRCPQFKQIGDLHGPFDLSLIPIGAYKPRHTFSSMHADPQDAVEIFRDTKSKRAMGIHWGTWALTMEDVMEPPQLLKDALRKRGLAEEGLFDVCHIGESREF